MSKTVAESGRVEGGETPGPRPRRGRTGQSL